MLLCEACRFIIMCAGMNMGAARVRSRNAGEGAFDALVWLDERPEDKVGGGIQRRALRRLQRARGGSRKISESGDADACERRGRRGCGIPRKGHQ